MYYPNTDNAILIKSENCNELVEKKKTERSKELGKMLFLASLSVLLILSCPYLIAILEDKNLSRVDGLPFPVTVILFIILVVIIALVFKASKKFEDYYTQYKEYCSTEVLIVDEKKIYGSTINGDFTLYYTQIYGVDFAPNVSPETEKAQIVPNDIFTVKDIAGNTFTFYSFKNCKDLKAIIDMQLRRAQNDKVR